MRDSMRLVMRGRRAGFERATRAHCTRGHCGKIATRVAGSPQCTGVQVLWRNKLRAPGIGAIVAASKVARAARAHGAPWMRAQTGRFPMVTKGQALTAREFHHGECRHTVGPRGGVTEKVERWRRNGRTQTWKTRPGEWRVPVKHGLYNYGEITHRDAACWHTAEDCPLHMLLAEIARGPNAA